MTLRSVFIVGGKRDLRRPRRCSVRVILALLFLAGVVGTLLAPLMQRSRRIAMSAVLTPPRQTSVATHEIESIQRSALSDVKRPLHDDNTGPAQGMSQGSPSATVIQQWPAASLYLPLPPSARRAFVAHQNRQLMHAENHAVLRDASSSVGGAWTNATWRSCFDVVPECAFFHAAGGLTLLAAKCCVEHRKLRSTLFYVADVASAHNLTVFLMFGTLLSSMRDGGGSLVPWETDIDLGILGADPHPFAAAFSDGQHYAEVCKTSGNDADPYRKGTCSDVHAVYHAPTKADVLAGARIRVELWPYRAAPRLTKEGLQRRNEKQLGAKHRRLTDLYKDLAETHAADAGAVVAALETVRRGELVLPRAVVLPLVADVVEHHVGGDTRRIEDTAVGNASVPPSAMHPCRLWGRQFLCPRYALMFLDLEYHGRAAWTTPKTIHWGGENAGGW